MAARRSETDASADGCWSAGCSRATPGAAEVRANASPATPAGISRDRTSRYFSRRDKCSLPLCFGRELCRKLTRIDEAVNIVRFNQKRPNFSHGLKIAQATGRRTDRLLLPEDIELVVRRAVNSDSRILVVHWVFPRLWHG